MVVLETLGIDTRSVHILDTEATERTCHMVEVQNGMNGVRIKLGVLDTLNIVTRTVLGNERRVASAETNRGTAVILTVRDSNPTRVENAVHERRAVDHIGRQVEENRGTLRSRGLEVEVDRTGGGGVL